MASALMAAAARRCGTRTLSECIDSVSRRVILVSSAVLAVSSVVWIGAHVATRKLEDRKWRAEMEYRVYSGAFDSRRSG